MSRPLVHYMAVAVSARLADEGAQVALVLLALERTNSAALGGALVGALLVPHVLAAPLMGALADRVPHRRSLYAVCLGGVGAALVCCAEFTGRVPPWVVLVIAAAGGCCGPMVTGGLTGLLRELVPESQRTRAYSFDSMSYNFSQVVGPAGTGVLVEVAGAPTATTALGMVAVGAGVLAFKFPIGPKRTRVDKSLARAVFEVMVQGASLLWRERSLRAVTLSTTMGEAGIGALPIAAALLADEYGSLSASGALVSVFAVGSLFGSLLYAR